MRTTAGVEGHEIASSLVALEFLFIEQAMVIDEADIIHTLSHIGTKVVDSTLDAPCLVSLVEHLIGRLKLILGTFVHSDTGLVKPTLFTEMLSKVLQEGKQVLLILLRTRIEVLLIGAVFCLIKIFKLKMPGQDGVAVNLLGDAA